MTDLGDPQMRSDLGPFTLWNSGTVGGIRSYLQKLIPRSI